MTTSIHCCSKHGHFLTVYHLYMRKQVYLPYYFYRKICRLMYNKHRYFIQNLDSKFSNNFFVSDICSVRIILSNPMSNLEQSYSITSGYLTTVFEVAKCKSDNKSFLIVALIFLIFQSAIPFFSYIHGFVLTCYIHNQRVIFYQSDDWVYSQ